MKQGSHRAYGTAVHVKVPLYHSGFFFFFFFWHAELAVPSHSEPLWWEKIGKVANQVKLAVPSYPEPHWWEKIGKVVNQAKLAILSHSEALQWDKIGKVANQVKLVIPSHSEALQWCIFVNFHCLDHSADHQKLNVIQK